MKILFRKAKLTRGVTTNGDGFLAPYRGHLYHLKEWNSGPHRPQTAEEYFNLRHAQARNVIERYFGLLKGIWRILRGSSWFSLQTQGRIVLAVNLLTPSPSVISFLLNSTVNTSLLPRNTPHRAPPSFGDSGFDTRRNPAVSVAISSFLHPLPPPCVMYESIASGGGRGNNKHFWSKEEDNALINALSNLCRYDPHWKYDNGFRNGYMTLVTKFRAIGQMLSTSGFKWDDEKQMIFVERLVYDEYCKVHPYCKNLYRHAFLHLNALLEIYVMIDSSDDEDISKCMGGKKETESASNSELAILQAFMKYMNVHLSTMTNVMSRADEREQQIVEKSEKVLDILLALDGITPQQALEVARILTAQPNKLLIFFKCPDALKCTFVKNLLD
ncbi:hypothetical protein RND81_08G094100 [Saponaria officinalis]|uniref:DDE Tnp4 domain-containing protein n=1 Tax=Saponaria officinalis TaxID=3572 RepID=A0AAW1J5P2_SAPOF